MFFTTLAPQEYERGWGLQLEPLRSQSADEGEEGQAFRHEE